MDEDSITFGLVSDPEDCGVALRMTLRDVFDASYRKLVVQLYAITGDYNEAEDLVQEAFVKAVANGPRFLRVDNKEAWLRTTAINAHRSRWRKKRNGRRAQDRMPRPRDPASLEEHVEIINALRA
ncbi:MAG: sigma factor, partial [Jiangellaceae bacterium]